MQVSIHSARASIKNNLPQSKHQNKQALMTLLTRLAFNKEKIFYHTVFLVMEMIHFKKGLI
jgi:hypothetical protein